MQCCCATSPCSCGLDACVCVSSIRRSLLSSPAGTIVGLVFALHRPRKYSRCGSQKLFAWTAAALDQPSITCFKQYTSLATQQSRFLVAHVSGAGHGPAVACRCIQEPVRTIKGLQYLQAECTGEIPLSFHRRRLFLNPSCKREIQHVWAATATSILHEGDGCTRCALWLGERYNLNCSEWSIPLFVIHYLHMCKMQRSRDPPLLSPLFLLFVHPWSGDPSPRTSTFVDRRGLRVKKPTGTRGVQGYRSRLSVRLSGHRDGCSEQHLRCARR